MSSYMNMLCKKNNKLDVRKGDEVIVISGDDKGKKGNVLFVNRKKSSIVVEGINKFKKAVKVDQSKNRENFLFTERGIDISNVKVIKKAAKVSTKKDNTGVNKK